MPPPLTTLFAELEAELESATKQFAPMNTPHEGYAVILEELDELWAEVKRKDSEARRVDMRAEALQVATMAIRFIRDVCD